MTPFSLFRATIALSGAGIAILTTAISSSVHTDCVFCHHDCISSHAHGMVSNLPLPRAATRRLS